MKECFVESVKEFDYTVLNEQVWSPDGNKVGLIYLREMMQDYLELMRDQGLPNVIHNELSYELKLTEGAIIRGYIDRIDKLEDGVYKVVDYKTSKNPKYLKDFQLLVYANAIKQIYPDAEKVVGSFMLLKHDFREVEYEFTDFDLENCMDEVMKNLELIQVEKNWSKNPHRS